MKQEKIYNQLRAKLDTRLTCSQPVPASTIHTTSDGKLVCQLTVLTGWLADVQGDGRVD